jgi:hypothetical protein
MLVCRVAATALDAFAHKTVRLSLGIVVDRHRHSPFNSGSLKEQTLNAAGVSGRRPGLSRIHLSPTGVGLSLNEGPSRSTTTIDGDSDTAANTPRLSVSVTNYRTRTRNASMPPFGFRPKPTMMLPSLETPVASSSVQPLRSLSRPAWIKTVWRSKALPSELQ